MMKKAYTKALRELISKMRVMEAKEDKEEEDSPLTAALEPESEMHDLLEENANEVKEIQKKPGVMARKGEDVYESEEDLDEAKKAFFKRPMSAPVKGKTKMVITSMTMKSPGKVPPTKRHMV